MSRGYYITKRDMSNIYSDHLRGKCSTRYLFHKYNVSDATVSRIIKLMDAASKAQPIDDMLGGPDKYIGMKHFAKELYANTYKQNELITIRRVDFEKLVSLLKSSRDRLNSLVSQLENMEKDS